MNDVKTWADIDASPLLQLPPEQRKKLHDANDERFRTFWAECFLTAQAPGRGRKLTFADGDITPTNTIPVRGRKQGRVDVQAVCPYTISP